MAAACATQTAEALEDDGTVKPTDPPPEVIGEATSLRRFARIDEAVRGVAIFGERFADMFALAPDLPDTPDLPDAPDDVRAATAFTRDIPIPGAPGAMFVARVDPGGPAAAAGLRKGDVLMGGDGVAAAFAETYLDEVSAAPRGETVEIVIARRAPRGGTQARASEDGLGRCRRAIGPWDRRLSSEPTSPGRRRSRRRTGPPRAAPACGRSSRAGVRRSGLTAVRRRGRPTVGDVGPSTGVFRW